MDAQGAQIRIKLKGIGWEPRHTGVTALFELKPPACAEVLPETEKSRQKLSHHPTKQPAKARGRASLPAGLSGTVSLKRNARV
jgi:hypothetical protein